MSQSPLHLLCVEPRFPGRLGAVADWLVRKRGFRCQFYCHAADPQDRWPESVGRGLEVVSFNVGGVARDAAVSWRRHLERGLCYAYGCWEVLSARRPGPFDVVLGRSAGLGSTLYVPVYQPRVPVVNFKDYYYHAHANDLADEAGPETLVEYFHWRRSANATELLDLENGATPWTTSPWQLGLFPEEYRDDFLVLYDGVDAGRFAPGPPLTTAIAGRAIPKGAKILTFVASSLDKLRGFDRFVELANRLLRQRSDVICVAAGSPIVQRGLDVEYYHRNYAEHVFRDSPPVERDRFWLLDSLSRPALADLLRASALHVYPSRRYPVSRSLVEAMAAGRTILATDQEPTRDFLKHERSGLLAAPSDVDAWERAALAVLDDPAEFAPLGRAALAVVQQRYSQDATLPRLTAFLNRLADEGA